MKKSFYFLLLIPTIAFANQPLLNTPSAVFNGSACLTDQTFDKLTINGLGTLTNVNAVTMIAHGAFQAQNCNFDTATIKGSTHLKQCTITQQITVKGGCTIEQADLNNISARGGLTLQNVKIAGDAILHGGVTLNHTKITGNAVVHGGATFNHTKITGNTVVHGGATFNHSEITEFIGNGTKTTFKDSTVSGSIFLKKPYDNTSWPIISWLWSLFFGEKQQQIILINTTVHGNIALEKQDGLVILEGSSTVHGTIANGIITQ